MKIEDIYNLDLPNEISSMIKKITENSVFELFPYAKKDRESEETLIEIEESIKNLNTRLSNLKKINKSLIKFEDSSSSLSWEELKSISSNLHIAEDEFIWDKYEKKEKGKQ